MPTKKLVGAIVAMLATLVVAACAKPLPPDRLNYAGEWHGTDMALRITTGGSVEYKRRKGSSTTSINAPIKEFDGNDFIVGMAGMSTRFVVSVPPHQTADGWAMTVDGVELQRVAGQSSDST
jgi:hypothetical protein